MGKYVETKILRKAVARLIIKEPFWAEMFFSMFTFKMPDVSEDPSFGNTLATDSHSMWINEDFYNALGKQPNGFDLQMSAIAHEIAHKMLHHPTRRGGRDPDLWNWAADEAANEILADSGFKLGPDWVQPVPARRGWTVEARYNALKEEQARGGGGGAPGGMWKDVMDFKGTTDAALAQEEKVRQVVERAMATAQGAGKVPAGLRKMFDLVFAPAAEPWYNHLHRFMQSLQVSGYNWSRPDRRMLMLHGIVGPDHYSHALGDVLIFRDTSGSCFLKLVQQKFMSHVDAIMAEAKPKRLVLADFDTRIHQHQEFERNDEVRMVPRGNGGTDFRPLFQWATDNGITPAVAIVATDMYGTGYPEEPDFPVIWCSTTPYGAYAPPPFGEVIHVN